MYIRDIAVGLGVGIVCRTRVSLATPFCASNTKYVSSTKFGNSVLRYFFTEVTIPIAKKL